MEGVALTADNNTWEPTLMKELPYLEGPIYSAGKDDARIELSIIDTPREKPKTSTTLFTKEYQLSEN